MLGRGGAAVRPSVRATSGREGCKACPDEGAPSFVEQKQLDELNIACTKKEEEE